MFCRLPSSNDFDMFSDKSDNGPSSNSSGDSILSTKLLSIRREINLYEVTSKRLYYI